MTNVAIEKLFESFVVALLLQFSIKPLQTI